MEYFYRAISHEGERTQGYIEAANQRAARDKILKTHASLLTLTEPTKASTKQRAFRVKQESVVVFFRRLSTLLSSGVPLADSLDFIGNAGTGDQLPEAVDYLSKLVQQGHSFSAALKDPRCAKVFDKASIGMISLGEQTGNLARIVDKLASLKERQLGLTRSFVSALTYPAVLLCCIIALGILFTMILGPGDDGLFAAFGAEMPWPTKVVQAVSKGVRNPFLIGAIILGGGSLIGLFINQMRTNPSFKQGVHSFALGTPAIGPLIEKVESARILYVVSDALHVGVPLLTAFGMATEVVGNATIKSKLKNVYRDFSKGEDLVDSLRRYDLFDTFVLSFLETGIESGNLDIILAQASVTLEEDVRLALDGISQLAEPLLLAFAGLMAGFLALATLMPIINMVDTL